MRRWAGRGKSEQDEGASFLIRDSDEPGRVCQDARLCMLLKGLRGVDGPAKRTQMSRLAGRSRFNGFWGVALSLPTARGPDEIFEVDGRQSQLA